MVRKLSLTKKLIQHIWIDLKKWFPFVLEVIGAIFLFVILLFYLMIVPLIIPSIILGPSTGGYDILSSYVLTVLIWIVVHVIIFLIIRYLIRIYKEEKQLS